MPGLLHCRICCGLTARSRRNGQRSTCLKASEGRAQVLFDWITLLFCLFCHFPSSGGSELAPSAAGSSQRRSKVHSQPTARAPAIPNLESGSPLVKWVPEKAWMQWAVRSNVSPDLPICWLAQFACLSWYFLIAGVVQ